MNKFCTRKGLLLSLSSQLNLAANKLTSLSRYTLFALVMSGFETDDYVSNTCEIVKVLNSFGESVATIFRKPNGGMSVAFPSLTCQLTKLTFVMIFPFFASEFEVQGACLVRNELKQRSVWYTNLNRYRELRIVTSSGGVLVIERHGSNGILLISLSLRFVMRKEYLNSSTRYLPF